MIVDRKELQNTLGLVAAAVSNSSPVPLFQRVLVDYHPENEHLLLRGTNGSVFLAGRCPVATRGDEQIAVAVLPDRFAAVLTAMRGPTVQITLNGPNMRVCSGKTDTVLAGLSGKEYPEIPELTPKHTYAADARLLAEAIRRVLHVAVPEKAGTVRSINGCVGLIPDIEDAETLVVMASSGVQQAAARVPMLDYRDTRDEDTIGDEARQEVPPDLLVPESEASIVARLLAAAGGTAAIEAAHTGLTVTTERYRGVFSIFEGDFSRPRKGMDRLLATDPLAACTVSREDLLGSVRGARAAIPKDGPNEFMDDVIALITYGGELHIRTGDRDGARFNDSIPCELTGEEVMAMPTGRFVAEALPVFTGDQITIQAYQGPNSTILVLRDDTLAQLIAPRTIASCPMAVKIKEEWEALVGAGGVDGQLTLAGV